MNTPWYRQFWPWFLIILPLSVVVASLATVTLFTQNRVSLVSEDYYKEGKGINQDLSRLEQAQKLGITANLTVSGKDAVIALRRGELKYFPTLEIEFQHRTLPEKDIQFTLNPDAAGNYRFDLESEIQGPWFIKISAFDQSWSLNARPNFPIEGKIDFHGKHQG